MRSFFLALALPWPAMAAASSLPPVEVNAASASSTLFVSLTVSGRETEEIVALRIDGDKLLVDAAQLRKAGVLIDGEGAIDVAHSDGLQAAYDAAAQNLTLIATPDRLPTQHVKANANKHWKAVADKGAMLNYTLYAQRSAGRVQATLWNEQRLFGFGGSFSNNGTLWLSRPANGGSRYLRYDTRYTQIDEDRALTFTAGDLITRSLSWSDSVRLGGIQISRDFRIRPDLVTMPLPSFAGSAAVPSAVDLFVDGYRRQGTDVQPGRFVLDDVPVVNGAGEATIVTTDASGRQVRTSVPFYVSSDLLKPGMSDFALEAGFLRQNYGLRNFDYGAPAASGSLRRGITRNFTIEAHGEATRRLQLAGLGANWAPGRFGTISLSATESRHEGKEGRQWSVAYSYQARSFGIAFQHDARSEGYRDLGTFDLKQFIATRRSDRVIGSLSLQGKGSLSVAYFSGASWSGDRNRIVSGSYSRTLGRRASLFVSMNRDLATHSTSAQLRLMVPLGRNMVGAGLSQTSGRGTVTQFDYDRSTGMEDGVAVDANVAVDRSGHVIGQGTATWRDRDVAIEAGGSVANGKTAIWGGLMGAVVWMDHELFTADQLSDAFAVVRTGRPGIPVTYENQPVGKTNKKGDLLVRDVVSFVPVRFAIDTLNLSAEDLATATEHTASVRSRSGAIIDLKVRKVRNAIIYLAGADGKPLATGGRVLRAGHPATEIGWDGVTYLEDVSDTMTLQVTRRDGGKCTVEVTMPPGAHALPQIGPVPCA